MAGKAIYDSEVLLESYLRHRGNISAASRETGAGRSTIRRAVRESGHNKPLVGGQAAATRDQRCAVPKRGVTRYILSCAQSSTHHHGPTLANMLALKRHYKIPDENVLISSFTYNQNQFGSMSVKRGTRKVTAPFYDRELEPFMGRGDQNLELAPGLVWCGRSNTLPTAKKPLMGLQTHTGRRSGIFPHVKLAMESVASGKHEATKFNATTGTMTQLNYIQKREGISAERFHSYGFVLVEVTPRGWYFRHLTTDPDGVMYDGHLRIDNGVITEGHWVADIGWGDAHGVEMDPLAQRLAWGPGGMMDYLRPRSQHLNDLLSFRNRNRHDMKDPHERFRRWVLGQESVRQEIEQTVEVLQRTLRPWCETIIDYSNHDDMFDRWLKTCDFRNDEVNSEFFLACELRKRWAIRDGETGWVDKRPPKFHLLGWAMKALGLEEDVRFLHLDEPDIICRGSAIHPEGIQFMHGHVGIGGKPGTPAQFAQMGRATNSFHKHAAGVIDLVWTAGTMSFLDLGYNHIDGWSHTQTVTYINGARQLWTMWGGGYRGPIH